MTVKVTRSAKISKSSIQLSDLRQLVEACSEMAENSYVDISISPGDYNQGNYYTLTVREL